jgi:hypothetical protein
VLGDPERHDDANAPGSAEVAQRPDVNVVRGEMGVLQLSRQSAGGRSPPS